MRLPPLSLPSFALRTGLAAQGEGFSAVGLDFAARSTEAAGASSRSDSNSGTRRAGGAGDGASASRERRTRGTGRGGAAAVPKPSATPTAGSPAPAPTSDSAPDEAKATPRPGVAGHATEPLIAIEGVSRHYGGAIDVAALADASLTIWPGEFVVILGPSGSGKTTLLNLIGGMDQPSGGEIVAAGYRISGASPADLARYRRESVSFIFQTFNLFPALTALENVEFGANIARRTQPKQAAVETLRQVGLGHRLGHFPHMLSGGEQQRVAIARALATGNPILLADEPTGELDFRTGVQILELLQEQAATGRAVIVVTHNREIARVADRVIELSSGRIVSDRVVSGPRPSLEDLHW